MRGSMDISMTTVGNAAYPDSFCGVAWISLCADPNGHWISLILSRSAADA